MGRIRCARRDRNRPIRYLILGGAQLAVGAAAIFARYGLAGAGPIAVAAARLSIAALLLIIVTRLRRRNAGDAAPGAHQRIILTLAGLALAVHFATWIASLDYTSVAVSTLLVATTPIWAAAYDAFVQRRAPGRIASGAFAAGALGLVLVVGFARSGAQATPWLGGALALAGAVAFAAYLLLVRTVRTALSTQTIVTHTYVVAALALVLAAAVAGEAPPAPSNLVAWGGILAMALVSQLLGHTAINASLRWFSPTIVSFANLLEPPFAAALAWLVFGEAMSGIAIIGGLIVLASVAVALRYEPPIIVE